MSLWIDEQVLQMYGLASTVALCFYLWIRIVERRKDHD